MVGFVPVTRNDIGTILSIYNYYIENTTATFHSIPLTPGELEEILPVSHPKYPSFLILDGNEPVGYGFLTQYKKRQAYDRSAELSIYLKPGCTGRGIGLSAIRHLEAAARASGIRVLVGTVCGENQASIRLMEKAGWSRCACLKNVGEKFGKVMDVVMYQKEL
jgi:phosphinothricin acetyltransferase